MMISSSFIHCLIHEKQAHTHVFILKSSHLYQGKKATLFDGSKHSATRHGEPIHHSPPSTNECFYWTLENAETSAP